MTNIFAMDQIRPLNIANPKVIISFKNSTSKALHVWYEKDKNNAPGINVIINPGQKSQQFVLPEPYLQEKYYNGYYFKTWNANISVSDVNISGHEINKINLLWRYDIVQKIHSSLRFNAYLNQSSEIAETYADKQKLTSDITKQEYKINAELKGENIQDSIIDVLSTIH